MVYIKIKLLTLFQHNSNILNQVIAMIQVYFRNKYRNFNSPIKIKEILKKYGICIEEVLVITDEGKRLLTSDILVRSGEKIIIKEVISKG